MTYGLAATRSLAALILSSVCLIGLTFTSVPFARAASRAPVSRPSVTVPAAFLDLLDRYVRAHDDGQNLERAVYSSALVEQVFAAPGSELYLVEIRAVDRRAAASPEAIYDLAKTLQLHWEARYALGFAREKARHIHTGSRIGNIAGYIAMIGLMRLGPSDVPCYFRVMRQLIPVTATTLGAAAGSEVNVISHHAPPSPAALMRLGVPQDASNPEDDQAIHDLLARTVSGTAAGIVIDLLDGFSFVNTALTPFKLNLPLLLTSMAVGYVVDRGASASLDELEYLQLRNALFAAREQIDNGLRSHDDLRVYNGADVFLKATIKLAARINRPLVEALYDEKRQATALTRKLAADPVRLRNELLALDLKTDHELNMIRSSDSDEPRVRDDEELALLLQGLATGEALSPDKLSATATDRREMILTRFSAWSARHPELDANARHEAFAAYSQGLLRAKDRALAKQFRAGVIYKDANYLLIQAAAYLRSTGKPYVSEQADALQGMVSQQALLANTGAP